jgi:hypothetical protein
MMSPTVARLTGNPSEVNTRSIGRHCSRFMRGNQRGDAQSGMTLWNPATGTPLHVDSYPVRTNSNSAYCRVAKDCRICRRCVGGR